MDTVLDSITLRVGREVVQRAHAVQVGVSQGHSSKPNYRETSPGPSAAAQLCSPTDNEEVYESIVLSRPQASEKSKTRWTQAEVAQQDLITDLTGSPNTPLLGNLPNDSESGSSTARARAGQDKAKRRSPSAARASITGSDTARPPNRENREWVAQLTQAADTMGTAIRDEIRLEVREANEVSRQQNDTLHATTRALLEAAAGATKKEWKATHVKLERMLERVIALEAMERRRQEEHTELKRMLEKMGEEVAQKTSRRAAVEAVKAVAKGLVAVREKGKHTREIDQDVIETHRDQEDVQHGKRRKEWPMRYPRNRVKEEVELEAEDEVETDGTKREQTGDSASCPFTIPDTPLDTMPLETPPSPAVPIIVGGPPRVPDAPIPGSSSITEKRPSLRQETIELPNVASYSSCAPWVPERTLAAAPTSPLTPRTKEEVAGVTIGHIDNDGPVSPQLFASSRGRVERELATGFAGVGGGRGRHKEDWSDDQLEDDLPSLLIPASKKSPQTAMTPSSDPEGNRRTVAGVGIGVERVGVSSQAVRGEVVLGLGSELGGPRVGSSWGAELWEESQLERREVREMPLVTHQKQKGKNVKTPKAGAAPTVVHGRQKSVTKDGSRVLRSHTRKTAERTGVAKHETD